MWVACRVNAFVTKSDDGCPATVPSRTLEMKAYIEIKRKSVCAKDEDPSLPCWTGRRHQTLGVYANRVSKSGSGVCKAQSANYFFCSSASMAQVVVSSSPPTSTRTDHEETRNRSKVVHRASQPFGMLSSCFLGTTFVPLFSVELVV